MNTVSTPWQDSCSSITSALKHMLNHEIVVDAIFKKDKISCLYAHKLVLSIWSPKFADWVAEKDKREMFSITFNEDEDVLKSILEYLYSPDDVNCFSKMPIEKLIQALEISERYEIKHVHKKCLNSLRRKKINPSNVIDYFDYGLKKHLNDIIVKCVNIFENEGISIKLIKEDFSITSLLNLLSLEKIAMNSEAELLSLAISWLSYPENKCYKPQVLSFIDLRSINCVEYQDICKEYPHFFSDAELSSIILSKLRQDLELLPKWYTPKIKSLVENNCSLCIHIHKRMKISKPLPFLKINKRKDLKSVTQTFGFQFQEFTEVKLMNVELSFGPYEISDEEFLLQLSLTRNASVKEYSVTTAKRNEKYKISFKSPVVLKPKDDLILKFNFRRGLLANNIHVVWPIHVQQHKLNSTSNKGVPKVNLSSSKLAFYLSGDKNEKYVVSSFNFNVCDDHHLFLSRKCFESGSISSTMNLDTEKDSFDRIPEKIHIKEEIDATNMDIDDDHQNFRGRKNSFKMEDTTLDSSAENQNYRDIKSSIDTTLDSTFENPPSSFRIVDYGSMANVKQELIDLTYEL